MKPRLTLLVVLIAGITVTASSSALAQPGQYYYPPAQAAPYQPPPPQVRQRTPVYRAGWTGGFDLGVGFAEDQTGVVFSGSFGRMLGPKFALMAELSGYVTMEDDYYSDCWDCYYDDTQKPLDSLILIGGAGKVWLGSRLWLKGTVGVAKGQSDYFGELSGLGVGVGAGVDIVRGHRFNLDLRSQLISGVFEDISSSRLGFSVGFSWF